MPEATTGPWRSTPDTVRLAGGTRESWKNVTLTPSSPVATGTGRTATHAQTFAASTLFSVSDPLVDVMAS